MSDTEKKEKKSFWYTLANFIVDKRKAIIILFVFAAAYCAVHMNSTQVNQDITTYLPGSSETRIGLTTMEEEFVTYGSARVMICNVTYEDALELVDRLEAIPGVKQVAFDRTEDHYKGSNALYDITVDGGNDDEVSIQAMNDVEELLKDYDLYVSSAVGATEKSMASLSKDMNMILALAILIIVVVLFISTKAFLEIPVLLITFGVAALLNKGTNFWLGEISSVTDSIAVVLQLALAIDYAIILCDRYMEEHEHMEPVEALKVALSKAIPEISSSSLTTVSGMAAMMFMQFRLGFDMGIVLVKAILFSLISVFLLMPGVILIFSKGIDKTMHKSFVPRISFVGKFAQATKYVIPPVFAVLLVFAFLKSSGCEYLYDVKSVPSATLSESRIAENKIDSIFGTTNQLVVMVPEGDYEKEAHLIKELEENGYVISVTGLANQDVNDDYTVTSKLKPRQFAELTDLDIEVVRILYTAYAYSKEQYGPVVTGIDDYSVPIIDMFLFLYDQYEEGYVTLDADLDETLTTLYDKLHDGELQLHGENYSRMVLNFNMPVEGQPTYDAMEEIRSIAGNYYAKDDVILVGNSTSAKDLAASFATDNVIISVLTALFVLIILFFTFKSAGLPVLLVLTIQGSIWINFAVPAMQNLGVYFIAYLIVSAIQMGATIDYAIVISSRYMELKKELSLKEAITETLNQAFPTIFTSGTILTCAGFLIGEICSDATVAAIGVALGRGTLISIILVLFVLPQILLLGDVIIEKTALTVKLGGENVNLVGRMAVSGYVRGEFTGHIEGEMTGILQGKFDGSVDSKLPGHYVREEEIPEEPASSESEAEPLKEDLAEGKKKKVHRGLFGRGKKTLGIFLLIGLCSLALTFDAKAEDVTENVDAEATVSTDAEIEAETLNITSEEEFVEFAKNCAFDAYSMNLSVSLDNDLDLTGFDFNGIPYFDGTFNGNNHKITGVSINAEGSQYGFFRYVGPNGVVSNLSVEGCVIASGSGVNIGGIVGCNKGTLSYVSFDGTVSGIENVGGIAGKNETNAQIAFCTNHALVLGTNYTGGIAGYNDGVILKCENEGDINTRELEASLDLGGIDLGTLNIMQNIATRSDMGGVAGYSHGLISESVNKGTVGYDHAGYNVGGIAGNQDGIITGCTNFGVIKGRKDVGGIVGQAEPYIESEYLDDKIDETNAQIDALNNTLTGINSTISYTSNKTSKYAQNMANSYKQSMDTLSSDLEELTKTIDEEYPEAKEYADNIETAVNNINSVNDGSLSSSDIAYIQENLRVINTNLTSLRSFVQDTGTESKDLLNSVTNELKKTAAYDNTDAMIKTVDRGVQSVTNSMSLAIEQMEGIRNTVSDGFAVVRGDEQYIADISSIETAATMNGVLANCINYGDVEGDINAGGIAGCMNIDYSVDPEFDFDFTESMSLVLRSTVNDVIIGAKNYGKVNSKKNYAGGIVGLESLGLIYNCEGYGNISTESGDYLGGIAGGSETTIQSCYSLCTVSGTDFVGGIAGLGYAVSGCLTIPTLNADGESVGSILGCMAEVSGASGNFYTNDLFGGIDNISYLGRADALSYEEIVGLENAPDGFALVTISFVYNDEIIDTKTIPYGGMVSEKDFPNVSESSDSYIVWRADSELTDIRSNLSVNAEEVRWETSVAGDAKDQNNKKCFLVIGEFYEGTTITLSESDGFVVTDADKKIAYAYDWSLISPQEKEIETVEGHFLIPSDADYAQVWISKNDKWELAETTEDGSYLVTDIPVGASFVVLSCYKEPVNTALIAAIAGTVFAVLVIIITILIIVKKAKKKAI